MARAGHPYPIWLTKHGFQKITKLDGLSIGIEFGVAYQKTEFVLSPGEAILFLTDGVTEAENETGKLFAGRQRLSHYFAKASGPPLAKGLLERIRSWRGKAEMNDDLTVVEIWREAHQAISANG